ncbi:hypothetical protein AAUPMC_07342, partial [Pasteurella multocida subsp. multocida str. Anand1_cattle]
AYLRLASFTNFDILDQKRLVSWDKHRCFPHLIAIVARKRIYPLTLNPQKRTSKTRTSHPS